MQYFFSCMYCLLLNAAYSQTDSLAGKFPIDSGYYKSFDSTKIYYEVRGNGTPVLLVHGFVSNSTSWKRTALYKYLLVNRYKIILPDLRGNGRSDKPHDSIAYDNDAEAKDLIGLMNFLRIGKYSVIGYSRGSIITARLLVLDDKVQKAVMGGMGADFTNPQWPRRIMFYRGLMGDSVPEVRELINYINQQHLDRLALAYMQRSQPSTSKEALAKITQPVLVICGDKDTDNGSADDLAKLLSHSTKVTVPGDHGHASSTPEFAKEVIQFLMKK